MAYFLSVNILDYSILRCIYELWELVSDSHREMFLLKVMFFAESVKVKHEGRSSTLLLTCSTLSSSLAPSRGQGVRGLQGPPAEAAGEEPRHPDHLRPVLLPRLRGSGAHGQPRQPGQSGKGRGKVQERRRLLCGGRGRKLAFRTIFS